MRKRGGVGGMAAEWERLKTSDDYIQENLLICSFVIQSTIKDIETMEVLVNILGYQDIKEPLLILIGVIMEGWLIKQKQSLSVNKNYLQQERKEGGGQWHF